MSNDYDLQQTTNFCIAACFVVSVVTGNWLVFAIGFSVAMIANSYFQKSLRGDADIHPWKNKPKKRNQCKKQ